MLPAPPGGFKLPFTLRVPRDRPPRRARQRAASRRSRTARRLRLRATAPARASRRSSTRTVDFAGPAAGLRRGRRGAAQRRVRRLGVGLRRALADRPRRQDPPAASCPTTARRRCPSLGPCQFTGAARTVGGLPFAAPGGLRCPGAGSLAVHDDDLYLSSTCEGGIQSCRSARCSTASARRRARGGDQDGTAKRKYDLESLKGITFNRWDPQDTGSTPVTRSGCS